MRAFALFAFSLFGVSLTEAKPTAAATVTIPNNHPLIHFNGRWDSSPGSWWASTGFKLNVQGLTSLTLNLGDHTSQPVSLGVSVDYSPIVQVNVSTGSNVIPLGPTVTNKSPQANTVVRLNVQNWEYTRLHLETIELNEGAALLPYTPSSLTFQFIGDSLSAGQYLPQGIDQCWTFLVGEAFKAENVIIAQPGIALTDVVSYENQHGMSFQYFETEDTGYYYTSDHDYTTPWNFDRDTPKPDVIVIHLGANDNGQNVPANTFVQSYLNYLTKLRTIYTTQPFLLITPWGWPDANGNVWYYYQGSYEQIADTRHNLGDTNTFLVNATGWVTWDDIFHDNSHPTIPGHQKIAGLFESWLKNFGIQPAAQWGTSV